MRARGFSVRELALTLLLLAVVVVVAVRLIDLRTRLLVVEQDGPGLGGVLEAAVRAFSRDLEGAGRGGVIPGEAIRPVEDNTTARDFSRYRDAAGVPVAVRAGTDQIGLRGVIRSSLLALGPSRGPDGTSVADQIRRDASSVDLRASAPRQDGDHAEELPSVIERLGGGTPRGKRFFLVADSSGRYAVALVLKWSPSRISARALDLVLDFTDREAIGLNPRGEANAALALGELVSGGLLDDLVWFVAQGAEGRPPDYVVTSDPDSMRFPHPYLAVARFAGDDRWEIARVGEDVEDFQVAWGLAGAGDALTWRGDTAGSPAPRAAELVDPAGRSVLRALKIALAAKSENRYVRGDGPRPPADLPPLLNAPLAGSLPGVEPVGWDSVESRRILFERASREAQLSPRAPAAAAPR